MAPLSYITNSQLEIWAGSGAPTRIIFALAKAWVHADLLPQNSGQYRAAVLTPALEDAIADAISRKLLV